MNKNIFIPNQKSRERLSIKLGLEFNESMQDWEYEISDCTRIDEFIHEYDKSETSESEKQSLMEIILSSLNDIVSDGNNGEFEQHLDQVVKRLTSNEVLHVGSQKYWMENDFEISSLLKKKITG